VPPLKSCDYRCPRSGVAKASGAGQLRHLRLSRPKVRRLFSARRAMPRSEWTTAATTAAQIFTETDGPERPTLEHDRLVVAVART
jgi:hypothetical protein